MKNWIKDFKILKDWIKHPINKKNWSKYIQLNQTLSSDYTKLVKEIQLNIKDKSKTAIIEFWWKWTVIVK